MVWLLAPAATQAHAELVLASPEPGTGLSQAPGAVVIRFTEPLNLSLSKIEVIDAAGRDVAEGPTLPVEGDPQAMRRRLGLLPVGQYTVRWTTFSTLDGHRLQGTYRFGVGTAASPETSILSNPLDSEGPVGLFARLVALAGLTLWAGSIVLRRVVLGGGFDSRRYDVLARASPALATAGTAVALVSSTLVATGSISAIGGILAGSSGIFRLVELATTGAGTLLGARAWLAGGLLALIALVSEAASGHAAASPTPLLAIASFTVHLGAVGVWLFAIVASALSRDRLREVLARFTPYAVGAAVVTGLTGAVNATIMLGSPADLVSTAYGAVVVAKVSAFVAMAAFGFLHYRRRHRPQSSPAQLRRPVRWELGAALLALAFATALVGFPNPPREAAANESLAGIDPLIAELGSHEALSLADASGPFVVGLTILPPRPGPVEFRVQVLGVDPGDGLRDARVSGSTAEASVASALTSCGSGCFAGTGAIGSPGEWLLTVSITSNRGPIKVDFSAPLPTFDGSADLARGIAAMERLRTARLNESLRGSTDGPQVVAEYRFEAPDRMAISVNGSQRVIVGEQQASRDAGSSPWQVSSFPAPGFSWPTRYYRDFWRGAAAVRIIGSEWIDGVPSDVVAFVRPDLPAWFRIWIGADGLVRRELMRADGHLMDHDYGDFDGPISVELPATVAPSPTR